MKKLVKTLKINKLLVCIEKFKLRGKCRKQSFDFMGKIEIEGKTRQNAENKQTFDFEEN